MRQGSKVDKFSTWMLGGAGAIAAILIANLDKLQSVFKPEWRWWFGISFGISAIAGILQKLRSIQVQIALEAETRIYERSKKLFEVFFTTSARSPELNHLTAEAKNKRILDQAMEVAREVVEEVCQAAPLLIRRQIRSLYKKALADPLSGLRTSTKWVFWQILFMVVQAVSLIFQIIALPFLLR
jgi:hypothetical protein